MHTPQPTLFSCLGLYIKQWSLEWSIYQIISIGQKLVLLFIISTFYFVSFGRVFMWFRLLWSRGYCRYIFVPVPYRVQFGRILSGLHHLEQCREKAHPCEGVVKPSYKFYGHYHGKQWSFTTVRTVFLFASQLLQFCIWLFLFVNLRMKCLNVLMNVQI